MEHTGTLIKVKISPLADELREVDVEPGTTIRQAIDMAGLSRKEVSDILLDEELVDLETRIEFDDPMKRECVITLLPRVQAG